MRTLGWLSAWIATDRAVLLIFASLVAAESIAPTVPTPPLVQGVKVDIGATLPYADPVGAAKFGCLFTLG